jgi:septal ring factor EnvC (AmiA/AmiB activator)
MVEQRGGMGNLRLV